jgi:serine phosphatase RsbU (regulator of sigma subunit)
VATAWKLGGELGDLLGGGAQEALDGLSAALGGLAAGGPLRPALVALADAAANGSGSELAVVRRHDGGEGLVALAVGGRSGTAAPELEGTRAPAPPLGGELVVSAETDDVAEARRRAAAVAGADTLVILPTEAGGAAAAVELYRRGDAAAEELAFARLVAAHVGLALAFDDVRTTAGANEARARLSLELAGAALAAGSDEDEAAEQIARLACQASGAQAAILWRLDADGDPVFLAAHGLKGELPDPAAAAAAVAEAIAARGAPGDDGAAGELVVPLGEPPAGALELRFADGALPGDRSALSAFAARAAVALRRARRARVVADELGRSQTLIAVVGQAIAQLSLAHTLETAVERVVELTGGGEVAVYLREAEGLRLAAASGDLEGPHEEVAERLLELALGPSRGRGFVVVEDARANDRLAGLEKEVQETGLRRALLVPLVVQDEAIGGLVVYGRRPRPFREGEEVLLLALSGQLAVAVQNARLHERTKELGSVLERALGAERRAARQLRGLFEISQSFAQSLSLEATLDAVARTVVELFDLDAAAIRMPNARGDRLETRTVFVREPSLRTAAETILTRPQPMSAPLARRLLQSGRPVLLAPGRTSPEDAHGLLEPFFAKGSSAAVLPLATPGEILGTVTLLSLDPARPLDEDAVEAAGTVASQAALAIDNARLYQQQKDFSETMQRSLLPRGLPDVEGLEVGHVYESSARVEVGGDVYDFMLLDDGRLAVVLGDVTGKGIQAAADMAMAKFAFRALARNHPEPADFLATANEVVHDEIELGKFITMLYVLVDPSGGTVASASAGHPPIRLLQPGGRVESLGGSGMALGIDSGQSYEEERTKLEPGAAIVLYTDGLIEARSEGRLYGEERLDAFLSEHEELSAQELAEAAIADCKAFAGGDLADDCAVVVIRLAR